MCQLLKYWLQFEMTGFICIGLQYLDQVAGEMVRWLRVHTVLTALPGDLSLVSTTHVGGPTTACDSCISEGTPHSHDYTYTQMCTYTFN